MTEHNEAREGGSSSPRPPLITFPDLCRAGLDPQVSDEMLGAMFRYWQRESDAERSASPASEVER
jgi:hypothetical protein